MNAYGEECLAYMENDVFFDSCGENMKCIDLKGSEDGKWSGTCAHLCDLGSECPNRGPRCIIDSELSCVEMLNIDGSPVGYRCEIPEDWQEPLIPFRQIALPLGPQRCRPAN